MPTHVATDSKPSIKVNSAEIPVEEFLTTQELMRLLNVKHKQTIYMLKNRGMPFVKIGKNYRFIKHEVIAFLKNQTEASSRKNQKKNSKV